MEDRDRAGALPPTMAVRVGGPPTPLPGAVSLEAEDGSGIAVRGEVPGDLPPGYYRVHTHDGRQATLVAAPRRVPQAPATW
ncbi:4-alpha-glucanotransferase, partial [Mycobacterium sp. ITM-2017-0098]